MELRIQYRPLESQAKFHRSEARFKGFSGPIGSGKSQALCQEAIRLAVCNPRRTGLIGAPTYPMLRDSTQASLFEALRASDLAHEFNKAENLLTLTATGSRIIFRSLDDYERLRGTNLAWFGVDELTYTQEDAWLRLEGRLRDPKAKRLCGFAVWTPKGFDWVYRKFIENPTTGYDVVLARPFENRHLLDKVPDFYERLRSSYDKEFFEQEALGSYLSQRKGRVYRSFNRAEHVAELERDESLPLRWALDFNVDPMSSVIAQIRDGQVEVIDEIVLNRATTEEACEEFERRFPDLRAGLTVYADATGRRAQTTGASDEDIVRRHFSRSRRSGVDVRIPGCNPPVKDRVNLVNTMLKTAAGQVSIAVSPRCRELVKDFEEVTWIEGTYEIDKNADKRRTHLSDALGYLLWEEFGKQDKVGMRKRRIR